MKFNIPNTLTLFRIILIPVTIYTHYLDLKILSLGIFAFMAITDYLDGYFARKLNQETNFGAIFDPIADKVVGISFYSYLLINSIIPTWFCSILIVRNFAQFLCIPILVWWLKKEFFVRPSRFAKWATAISDIFIIIPLYFTDFINLDSTVLIIIMSVISIIELRILLTYLPRLYQIAIGAHDTFE